MTTMVSISCEWPTSKWLLQGLLTSMLSGVGFVFITLAFEYAKRYSRERKEREQQVILQKLLRGEVSVEWNNSQALVPIGRECYTGRLPSTNKGSILFNTYKKCGGFLGFGRGYYASRSKDTEELESDIDDLGCRMIEYTNWSNRIPDKIEPKEKDDINPENEISIFPPCEPPSSSSEHTSSQNLNMAAHSNGRSCSIRSIQSDLLTKKTAGQDSVCKKMCEEMCYRIVKEHPFLAPFLRHDLLNELQLEVSSVATDSSIFSNSGIKSKKQYAAKAICQPKYEPTPVVNYKPNTKTRARSMSRSFHVQGMGNDAEIEKLIIARKTSNNANKPKKTESSMFRKALEITPECRCLQSYGNSSSRQSSSRKLKRGRSFSLSNKSSKKNSLADLGRAKSVVHNIPRNPELSITAVSDRTCEDIAERGSSVDPTTPPVNINEEKYEDNQCDAYVITKNENAEKVAVKNMAVNTITQSEKNLGQCDSGSAEERIAEIASALTSWGFPIKSQFQNKKTESVSFAPKQVHENVLSCFGNQSTDKVPTAPSNMNSKVLADLFECLASSEKNRKILRQISYVLNKNKQADELSERANSFTRAIKSSPAATKTKVTAKGAIHEPQDKQKEIYISNANDIKSSISKGHLTKHRNLLHRERSASVKLPQDSSSLASKKLEINESSMCGLADLPPGHVYQPASALLKNECRNRLHSNVTAVGKLRKIHKHYHLKRPLVKKTVQRPSEATETENSQISDSSTISTVRSDPFPSQLLCITHDNGEKGDVIHDDFREDYSKPHQSDSKSRIDNERTQMFNTQIERRGPSVEVETNYCVRDIIEAACNQLEGLKMGESITNTPYGVPYFMTNQLTDPYVAKENEIFRAPTNTIHSNASNPKEVTYNASSPTERSAKTSSPKSNIHKAATPKPKINTSASPKASKFHRAASPKVPQILVAPSPKTSITVDALNHKAPKLLETLSPRVPRGTYRTLSPKSPITHRTPSPKATKIHRALSPKAPQTHRTPSPKAPQTHRTPSPKAPQTHITPSPKAPQTHRTPSPKAPQTHRTPSPKAPQTHRTPSLNAQKTHRIPSPKASKILNSQSLKTPSPKISSPNISSSKPFEVAHKLSIKSKIRDKYTPEASKEQKNTGKRRDHKHAISYRTDLKNIFSNKNDRKITFSKKRHVNSISLNKYCTNFENNRTGQPNNISLIRKDANYGLPKHNEIGNMTPISSVGLMKGTHATESRHISEAHKEVDRNDDLVSVKILRGLRSKRILHEPLSIATISQKKNGRQDHVTNNSASVVNKDPKKSGTDKLMGNQRSNMMVGTIRGHKSNERRSRFDQYQNNKKITNDKRSSDRNCDEKRHLLSDYRVSNQHGLLDKTEANNNTSAEHNLQNRNKTLTSCTQPHSAHRKSSVLEDTEKMSIERARRSPISHSEAESKQKVTVDNWLQHRGQNDHQIINSDILLAGTSFQQNQLPKTDRENVVETKTQRKHTRHESGLLKKSALDDVVKNMMNLKFF